MKKALPIFSAMLLSLLFSCEESFSPKGEFEDDYALNCIIRYDTLFQIASLLSSFDVDGYDPSMNKENSAYLGADIRLWYKDTVYIFKDSSVINLSFPDSLLHFYYLDNFKPDDDVHGELIEIEALLKDGKRLKASCYTPGRIRFNNTETSSTIPAVNTPTVNIIWDSEDESNYFHGRIKVKYFETEGGVVEEKWFELPYTLTNDNDEVIPIYNVPSRASIHAYSISAINYAFDKISEGNENKRNYKISNTAIVEVLSIEENLSNYYSSSLEDNIFTVRLNQTDYTNVEGGFGIFGSLRKEVRKILIQASYIESFGYEVLFEN